jgi:hypothetical protein
MFVVSSSDDVILNSTAYLCSSAARSILGDISSLDRGAGSGTQFALEVSQIQTKRKTTNDGRRPQPRRITFKNPPHWRQSFQIPWSGSPPKGGRDASHDPPLALSQYNAPDMVSVPIRRPWSQPVS